MGTQTSQSSNSQKRVAVVTGAARGIGAAIAKGFAQAGTSLALVDLDETGLNQLKEELKGLPIDVRTYIVDVSQYEPAHGLIDQIASDFGRLDILVNNAGITRDALLDKMTEVQWDDVLRVNLKGPFNLGQAVIRKMLKNRWGRIINIASVARFGNIGQSNYSAAKSGIVGLTRTWAVELARYGIRTNAVAPGFIETPMTQKVPENIREAFIQKIPLKRMGKPEEVAALICFLCSEAADYINGQCIEIDGGLTTGV